MTADYSLLATLQVATSLAPWEVALDLLAGLGIPTLVGVLIGAWLNRRTANETIVQERRIDAVAEFIGHAEAALQYLVEWVDPREGAAARFRLTILGQRAALYVGTAAREAIDEYTSAYATWLQARLEARNENLDGQLRHEARRDARDAFGNARELLAELTDTLRREVGISP